MGNSYFINKWKHRLHLLYHLPFSNRSLKYFPPKFIVRDPVISLIHRARKQKKTCGLIFITIDHYTSLLAHSNVTAEEIGMLFKKILTDLIKTTLSEEQVVCATQFHDNEFGVFIQDELLTFDQLQEKQLIIHKQLEEQLQHKLNWDLILQCLSGCYLLNSNIIHTGQAVNNAYQYARAIATKKLQPNFGNTKKQLEELIETENISVLAQPIMDLSNGDIFGWEILTRGPQGTPFHLPTDLFEFAHQADILTSLEFTVIMKALREISERQIKEQVFINITAVSLCHPQILNKIIEYMKRYPQISTHQIVFEITERHQIKDYKFMATVIEGYRARGFRFAVDDAGAGYSSLQSISELIPDIIKIDKSVIQNIDQAAVKQSILKALLFFAENINCMVIAEGVEREEEAEILFKHNVQMGQGYYFAKPAPLIFDYERSRYDQMRQKILLRSQTSSA